jgi:TPR repeat protein
MKQLLLKQLILAAGEGDAGAQYNLGIFYANHVDDNDHSVAYDRAESIKWFLEAAEQGLPRAQLKLGEAYAHQPVAPEDYVKACTWFLVAAANSSGIHQQQARSGYAQASSKLTPARIATARARARVWKPQSHDKMPVP